MKLLSLALAASLTLGGYAHAQAPAQTQAPGESQPAPSTSAKHPLSKSCRSEVRKLCGSTHGNEMTSCVKDKLDQDKFSGDCTTQLKTQLSAPQPAP
jgi:hypothetical protein